MGQWMAATIQSVEDTPTYRDVMCRAWYNSTEGVNDSSNSFNTSGDFPDNSSGGSVPISIPFGGGAQKIHEKVLRVPKQYGASTDVYFAAWLSGINFWGGGQVYDNATYTVPARAYATPTAPTGVGVTRNSDSSHTLTWTRQASTAGRYQNQYVQRRTFNGSWSGWQTIHTITTDYTSTGSHSYTDTTTASNRVYDYRVQAANSSGTANSVSTAYVLTTPAAPTNVAAAKSGANVKLTIDLGNLSPLVDIKIEHSANGGAFTLLATVEGENTGTKTYTHAAPNPAQTHQYRVSVVVDYPAADAGNGLASGTRTSNVVSLAAPPAAPTDLGPSSAHDATEVRVLRWKHNPVDTSEQTAFRIRHREPGGGWNYTTKINSDVSEWPLPADSYPNDDEVEWEVQTWGEHSSSGPFSATASFPTSARPTVSIDSPADASTLADSQVTAAWSYYQASGSAQVQWRATLLDELGNNLEDRVGSGATAAVSFNTRVADASSYTVRVEVLSAAGLWSEPVEVHFDVAYLPPALVDATATWDRDSGAVTLALEPQGWDDISSIEPVSVTVERSSDAGETWTAVVTESPLGGGVTTLVDPVPPTRAEVLYRVTSISELPSMAVAAPVPITIDERGYSYLSYGPGLGTTLTFYGNLRIGSQTSRQKTVEYFAGRTRPDGAPAGVIIDGEETSRVLPVSVRLLHDDAFAGVWDFELAALAQGVVCYRDVTGRRIFGSLRDLSTQTDYAAMSDLTFAVEEVGHDA